MKKVLQVAVVVVVVGLIVFFGFTPAGKSLVNQWEYSLERVDEKTYENQKKVEDTCRAMIASYEKDKLTWEHYKDSENAEERSWANSAKMRANSTAASYNNYILKNSYVWKGNVPNDIYMKLEYIE